jgi:3-dehydroquinate dehydratase-1
MLFTIRTAGEGGEADITAEDYFFINRMVADSKMADLIDIEAFIAEGTDLVSEFIRYAHAAEQMVVLSNHDFEKTPAVEEMVSKYDCMNELEGDIIKLAVMPHSEDDVAALLEAASLINDECPEQPLIAISMGELGMSSRICAGQFGSVITFAAGKDASAPGQIDAVTLQGYLEKYYK